MLILGCALVCLSANAQGSAPARLHHKTAAASGAHATRRSAPAPGRHHPATKYTHTATQVGATRKPTPDEAGFTAGLAIRRRLRQQQAARRAIALRMEPSRAASRPQWSSSQDESQVAPAMENPPPSTGTSTDTLSRPAEAESTEMAEAVAPALPRVATPAPSQAQNSGVTNEEMDFAAREGLPKGSQTAEADTPAINANQTAEQNPIAPAAHAAPNAGTEEASLQITRAVMPAPLRGSLESLQRQNARLDAEGLERIEDEADLADRIDRKLLVPIPASSALVVNADLSATHRYCRPWTARFLADLARAHDAAFHRPLEVNSAVRTVESQKRLMETNGNAAPAEGDIVSPHLTGATIDIAKDRMSRDEMAWMRRRLLALETAGGIDVEEEFKQACFHITVYKSYAPPRASRPASQGKSGSAASKRRKTPDPSGAVATQGL